ncbi:helicase HerA-like domain-containing protein [Cognatilysobacter terrigena]|uniref:helicase HerA-like domain-containing protein n=1 Tax=Cognatilysobacter terrigena TaxID=2488749 RepID=UPI00105E18F5|nr:helicase HerA-like domain-containing protein [Lysobacter terrigena]
MTLSILLGKTAPPELQPVELPARTGNRHGLVAGATGTGKTVSLMTLAEEFSRIGVPVFMADVKGDVAGLAMPGTPNERLQARLTTLGITDHAPAANPVIFWDLFGTSGHPVRATVSEVGPILLSRMLELNETQSGVLDIAFKLADDQGLLLLDLEDLRAVLAHVAEERKSISTQYGLVSAQSIAAIQRALLRLESDGGHQFFGEPALELPDLMRTTPDGRGVIGVLAADSLALKPRLYSTFLLWLLSELFEQLPEVGDVDKPKLVFIFDEAHLLFDDATPALQQRVEQVVRLIRSKGVGVYFCSQFPDDVPSEILGQLGNRVQHALRAFTPRDQKAVRVAAETFVPNPKIDVEAALTQLAIGEALVSVLSAEGVPSPVQRVLMAPPRSRLGPVTAAERQQIRASSPVGGKYDQPLDRDSAAEMLARRAESPPPAAPSAPTASPRPTPAPRASNRQGIVETMAKQAARTVGSQLGRQIVRGLLGGLLGGRGRSSW